MKKILNCIPGFRSRKIWKMIIASLYYVICLTGIFDSFATFLVAITLPFIFFGFASAIRKRSMLNLLIAIVAVIVCIFSAQFVPPAEQTQSNETNINNVSSTAAPISVQTPQPTTKPTPSPPPQPTVAPPTAQPTQALTITPAPQPTAAPPTTQPTQALTITPAPQPTAAPVNNAVNDSTTQTRSIPNSSNSEIIVYIGKTGTKYHRQSCRTLKGNGIPITLEEAKSQGRQACQVCNP